MQGRPGYLHLVNHFGYIQLLLPSHINNRAQQRFGSTLLVGFLALTTTIAGTFAMQKVSARLGRREY